MSSSQDESNPIAANPVANINDYELNYLVDHLLMARRSSEVNRLLFLRTADGRNAWYEVKDTRIGTYLIGLAWTSLLEYVLRPQSGGWFKMSSPVAGRNFDRPPLSDLPSNKVRNKKDGRLRRKAPK